MAFTLESTAFANSGSIPRIHTCEGRDLSPPLSWRDAPAGARSFVLIVDDPDAPDPAAPKRTWVHWVLYNIPIDVTGLPEGAGNGTSTSGLAGLNDWKRSGYGGPCPPIGRHRYFHKLYALDAVLPDMHQPDKTRLLAAMQGNVLAESQLVGTYEKGQR
jgi:Raf kinase inhibitor-like YbhB/YbcL family protein